MQIYCNVYHTIKVYKVVSHMTLSQLQNLGTMYTWQC